MQKITPFLWFNDNAEEAMNFYASIFKNAKIGNVSRFPEGTPGPAGKVISATFQLEGQDPWRSTALYNSNLPKPYRFS